MRYLFECGACRKTTEIDIKLENYDSEKERQRCSCGGKMKRVIEWQGYARGSVKVGAEKARETRYEVSLFFACVSF